MVKAANPRVIRRVTRAELGARLPYPVAPYFLIAVGDTADLSHPARRELPALDEGPHREYAIQWFIFAAIAVVGAGIVAWRDRSRVTAVHPEMPRANLQQYPQDRVYARAVRRTRLRAGSTRRRRSGTRERMVRTELRPRALPRPLPPGSRPPASAARRRGRTGARAGVLPEAPFVPGARGFRHDRPHGRDPRRRRAGAARHRSVRHQDSAGVRRARGLLPQLYAGTSHGDAQGRVAHRTPCFRACHSASTMVAARARTFAGAKGRGSSSRS